VRVYLCEWIVVLTKTKKRMVENMNDDVESRLSELERLLFNSSIKDQTVLGVEALLDAFIVLYDECCSSTLRREKTIAEFIEHG
jgi:hypothetical protein